MYVKWASEMCLPPGCIAEELFIDFHIAECNDVKQTLKDYIYYYDNKRPAYSLGYVTPNRCYNMYVNGEMPRKDTFSRRELSEVPKFGRKKLSRQAAKLEKEKSMGSDRFGMKKLDAELNAIEENLVIFNDATSTRHKD